MSPSQSQPPTEPLEGEVCPPVIYATNLPATQRPSDQDIMSYAVNMAAGAQILRIVVTRIIQAAGDTVVDVVIHTALAVKRGQIRYHLYIAEEVDAAIRQAQRNVTDPVVLERTVARLRGMV